LQKKVTGQHLKVSRWLKNDFRPGSLATFALQVSLREWIDRRIGGEVATKLAKNGQVPVPSTTFGHRL